MSKKVVVLLPVISQPRLIKRVNELINLGNEVTVIYQERDYFKLNKLPDNCIKIPLIKVENGRYLKRIFTTLMSIWRIIRIRKTFDVIYAFSFDLLIVSLFITGKRRLYEIGDLRKINSIAYDTFYKFLLKKQNKIIVTSSEFGKYLHKSYSVPWEKIKVIENKIELKVIEALPPRKIHNVSSDVVIIGVIGLLRYPQTIDFIKAIVGTDRLIVHIYGAGSLLPEIMRYVDGKKVVYFGEFQYPNDLTRIYEKIDFSFVMYDSGELNVRLALPNKLYESIYFGKPLIVSSQTYLEKKVKQLDIGFSHDINDIENLPGVIFKCIEDGSYKRFVRNCNAVETSEITKYDEDEIFN